MAKYFMNVFMTACQEIEVEARNEEEAMVIAMEDANPAMIDDWDYEVDCVYRDGDDDDDDDDWESED